MHQGVPVLLHSGVPLVGTKIEETVYVLREETSRSLGLLG